MQERTVKGTVFSIALSIRSHGASPLVETPVAIAESNRFCELFCATLQLEPLAPEEPAHSPEAPKALKDSRWAKDDIMAKVKVKPNTLHRSSKGRYDQKDGTKHTNGDRKELAHKRFLRGTSRRNTTREVRDEKEAPPEPPRVNFNWEEFEREVKENNLKTLKDSRWAD
ncbi:hypothetical protein CIB48_g1404 [Xylaria polymorpha]|nr:hypothetical protein CIB48_g1404 [Xylaria polymorpha]